MAPSFDFAFSWMPM